MTKVATWNVGDGPDSTKARGLVQLVKNDVDVICLQECGDRRALLEEFCKRTGYEAWFGDGSPGAASVPILWDPKTVHATAFRGTTPATPPTKVGRRGAGPSTMKAKVWNRVRFIADLGPVVVINGHIVPSVYLPARRRLARKQIAVLAEMVTKRKGVWPVVALGDFNMRDRHPLTKPLRKLGMRQRTDRATHGRRTIDHAWTLGVGGMTSVLEMPSDHNAVLLPLAKEIRR